MTTPTMLQDILDHKVRELEERRRQRPLRALTEAPAFAAARRDLAGALAAPGRRIVAEVKRASPSRGRIREDFVPTDIAAGYAAAGADGFLLIAAILRLEIIRELVALGRELGMAALVEVHTREQLDRALAGGATLIGIKNRDLDTFVTRLETGFELLAEIPDACTVVIESGLKTPSDLVRFEAAGAHAFLIGEAFMTAPDPGARLREFLV
jgi:indole-3-glycerol phosphate synthase